MLILILVVPIAEIATFVWVGSRIGVGMTLLLVVIGVVVGLWLVRRQGFATAGRVQAMIARGESPAQGMLEGMALLAAGLLFVLPGFVTDIAAVLLLIRPLRRWLIRLYLKRAGVDTTVINHPPSPDNPDRTPLEGESRRVD
ncbi:MAG: FxsA family protein [Bacteroidota bacterium]